MDNITHTLIGVAMANAGLRRRFGPGTTLTLALASNAPDIDVFVAPLGEMAFLWRRTLTHSVFGLPLLCAVLALALAWLYRRRGWQASWRDQFLLCLLAGAIHMFADLWNSYGVVLLWPLSSARFELGWVFIIDIVVWACVILPLLIGVASRRGVVLRRASQAGLAALAVYVGLCAGGRLLANTMLNEQVLSRHPSAEFSYVFPEPFGPQRFRGVVRENNEYTLYLIQLPSGRLEERRRVKTDDDDPLVQHVRQTPNGRRLDWFAKAPVWTIEDGGEMADSRTVLAADLRFRSLLIDRGGAFTFCLDADGQIIRRKME